MGIDFTDLAQVFNNWANDWMPTQQLDWLGVDGKSIKATVSNYDKAYQDFINVVSVWVGLARLVKVERIGTRASKPYHQVAYYISSLSLNATQFAQGIRGHWGIENRLHWVKDVVLEEDTSRMRLGNAPGNLSIIRCLAISFAGALRAIAILRYNGYSYITTAVRMIGHNLEQIFLLIGKVAREA